MLLVFVQLSERLHHSGVKVRVIRISAVARSSRISGGARRHLGRRSGPESNPSVASWQGRRRHAGRRESGAYIHLWPVFLPERVRYGARSSRRSRVRSSLDERPQVERRGPCFRWVTFTKAKGMCSTVMFVEGLVSRVTPVHTAMRNCTMVASDRI